MRRYAFPAVLAVLAGLAAAFYAGVVALPPAYDPFQPLDIRAEPNLVTRIKLRRLQDRPDLCLAALESAGFPFRRLADQPSDRGCPLTGTVRVSGPRHGGGLIMTCPLAVALAMFERHVLAPASEVRFGQDVRRLESLGTYACRNIYGRARGRRSEHASANAFDLAGVVLDDGRTVSIRRDWRGDDEEARFLRDIRDGACRFFNVVLSPDYNAAHADHLHLDMGPFRTCR